MVIYLALMHFFEPTRLNSVALYSAVGFLMLSFMLFAWVVMKPVASPLRKVIGVLHDIGGPTYGMIFFGTTTVPFYIVYLWVIFGNGFRYGTPTGRRCSKGLSWSRKKSCRRSARRCRAARR